MKIKQKARKELNTHRVRYALEQLEKLGIKVIKIENANEIWFGWKGSAVRFFPYTGWHTGKTIKDGRGIENLLKQLT